MAKFVEGQKSINPEEPVPAPDLLAAAAAFADQLLIDVREVNKKFGRPTEQSAVVLAAQREALQKEFIASIARRTAIVPGR